MTPKPTVQPTPNPTVGEIASPTAKPTIPGTPSNEVTGVVDVPINPSATDSIAVSLPSSVSGSLLIIYQVSDDNDHDVQVGRSYDGLDWETLHPLLLPIDCQQSTCVLHLPADTGISNMHYVIHEYNPPAPTDDQKHAKLLLQGTYGPTQESLQEARSLASAEAWVRDQIDKPVSLHRVHYRQRTNGYVKNELHHHAVRNACDRGSRWNRHAFNRWRDIGKTIEEVPSSNGFYLKVDGIVRTEVSTRPSADYNLGSTTYVICRKPSSQDTLRMSDFHFAASTGQHGTLLVATDSASCTMPISSKFLCNTFISG